MTDDPPHDEQKESFAKLSHKLRNQLAAILSTTELLKLQGTRSPDTPLLLRTIDEHARTMVTMLNDFT